jgi:mono/diheme cytochrome c family protein
VAAATAWTGGLFVLAGLALAEAARWPGALLPAVMRRFSRLAAGCLLAVVVSGAYRAWVELPTLAALWRTPYGRVLAVKLLLVLGLVWCGAINRYLTLPRLGAGRARGPIARLFRLGRLALIGPSRARRPPASRLGTYVRREAALALLVFGCTAVLVESTPARHAGHLEHAAVSDEPVRMTMAELHASGGIPPGWLFRPPPGDAARGRRVFVRLGCFACHQVSGEGFPPSSGLGPDLTGMGDHHPAGYLLESVINPSAVIVEGRGHIGPDGRSVMPSYADRLTVGELLDLVAYLRSL